MGLDNTNIIYPRNVSKLCFSMSTPRLKNHQRDLKFPTLTVPFPTLTWGIIPLLMLLSVFHHLKQWQPRLGNHSQSKIVSLVIIQLVVQLLWEQNVNTLENDESYKLTTVAVRRFNDYFSANVHSIITPTALCSQLEWQLTFHSSSGALREGQNEWIPTHFSRLRYWNQIYRVLDFPCLNRW